MKQKIIVLSLLFLLLNAVNVYAHPGRTDGNGGHTCRTNCPKWGLEYGKYHYHNGNSSSNSKSNTKSSSSSSSSSSVSSYTDEQIRKMNEQEYNEGYSLGLSQGQIAYENSLNYEYYMSYGYGTNEYYNGHKKGFEDGFEKAKKTAAIEQVKKQGHSDGLNLLDEKKTFSDIEIQAAYDQEYRKGYQIADESVFNEGFEAANQWAPVKNFSNESDLYIKIYKDGYEKGYKNKLSDVEKEGYESAFINNTLIIPSTYESNKDAKAHYINGFENNQDAIAIKSQAYDDGLNYFKNDKELKLVEYSHAKNIYSKHYDKGKNKAVDLYKKIAIGVSTTGAIATLPVAVLFVRRNSKNKAN